MSTSGGVGATAVEIVGIYPPEITRFLMLRTHPKRHIEFDPAGMSSPRLVDESDRCADEYPSGPQNALAKIWRLSQVLPRPAPPGIPDPIQLIADLLPIPT